MDVEELASHELTKLQLSHAHKTSDEKILPKRSALAPLQISTSRDKKNPIAPRAELRPAFCPQCAEHAPRIHIAGTEWWVDCSSAGVPIEIDESVASMTQTPSSTGNSEIGLFVCCARHSAAYRPSRPSSSVCVPRSMISPQ
jgi:hypothetical protein